MAPRRATLVAALLLLASAARSAQPPASITISGGVSLGSYEAGLVYYLVETMRLNPAAATPRVVTGASAGSVNGFMTILQSCGAPVSDPEASLFWRAWIPLGLEKLHVKGQPAEKTSAFSRSAFEAPLDLILNAWKAGLPPSCDAVFGLSVTRLVPRIVGTEGDKLRLPRVEEHFVVRIQGRGTGKAPRLTNYVDPKWEGEQALLPEKDGEVIFEGLIDALFASTAFPGAFPPQALRHCVVSGGMGAKCPMEKARTDLFVDGGVFDNTPVRLATRAAAAGLRENGTMPAKWLDAPDFSVRNLPKSLVVGYISTDARTFPETADEPSTKEIQTLLGVTVQVGMSFLSTARAKNLLYVHDDTPEVFEQLLIPERHLPAASAPLGAFFGFVESELRRFDFALGMYDGRRAAETRLERAGARPKFPEEAPGAREGAAGWHRYTCLKAVMDGAPGASDACAGDDLRDFRVVLQTGIEKLWDACAALKDSKTYDRDPLCRRARVSEPVMAVPFVDPLPGQTWRRGAAENETGYSMRLLSSHGFWFKDLGLAREEAEKAPAALRARLLEIGDSVAATQPTGEGLMVSTMVKVVADQVTYVPARFTLWAVYGRDPEIGVSKGFETGGVFVSPLRLHAALQFTGTEGLLSSESDNVGFGALLGAEYLPSWWASTQLQPSLLLRAGWLFATKDAGGFGTCENPGSSQIGSCSRPMLQGGVSATVLERIRLQATFNYYFTARKGQESQWAVGPGIGAQWGF
ncbi:MAG: patatin-like phospholipase family protein [Myxococcales bacterium]